MIIEINIDGKVEQVEMELEAKEAFEKMAEIRGIPFDNLIEALLRASCAEAEQENG